MFAFCARSSPWITLVGVLTQLVGLSWDAALHRREPALAAQEGIFTLTNPAHLLFGAGTVLILVGMVLFLLGRVGSWSRLSLSRRTAIVVPLTALLALSGIATVLARSSSNGVTHAHEMAAALVSPSGILHEHGEGVSVTAQELSAAAQLVEDVRKGTERFADFSVAQSEGYRQITRGRAGLAHYHNQAYHTDGRILDPERPEDLVYWRLPNGKMKLLGAMFLAPPGEAGPRVGGPLTAWHSHDSVCWNRAQQMIAALADQTGQCPAGTVRSQKLPEMLHVWLFDNPDGVFSEKMEPAGLLAQLVERAKTR